jgi:hypothetical protein
VRLLEDARIKTTAKFDSHFTAVAPKKLWTGESERWKMRITK